ncbi:MAG: hypothetical protein KJ015_09765 [Myxococcales bacterium]|nr:hypothetical protein [Myxococcales bacterium]
MTFPYDELGAPELVQLTSVLGREVALRLATHPGGWRTLGIRELGALGLSDEAIRSVIALQDLVRRGYPELPRHRFVRSEDVARVYEHRLGGLDHKVMVAVALDGRMNVMAEIELASGGCHGIAIAPSDIFRPLVRSGATAYVLVHNHPSSDPTPSHEDISMTGALTGLSDIVGVQLVDHVIVAARGGGWTSLADLGLLGGNDEERPSHSAVSS